MSRLNMGRYKPSRWPYSTPEEWMTPQEHRALKDEFLVMLILVSIGLVCVFAEPLMDAFMAMLGVR